MTPHVPRLSYSTNRGNYLEMHSSEYALNISLLEYIASMTRNSLPRQIAKYKHDIEIKQVGCL